MLHFYFLAKSLHIKQAMKHLSDAIGLERFFARFASTSCAVGLSLGRILPLRLQSATGQLAAAAN